MPQWWERSPPTNLAWVPQILASTPYVCRVCCWFSYLLREVFLLVLRFFPLLKNQHFQIPIRPGIRYKTNHFVGVLPLNRTVACTVLNNISTDASERHPVHCLCERTLFIAIKVTTYIEYTTLVVSSFNSAVQQYNCITCYTKLRNYVIAVREWNVLRVTSLDSYGNN